VPSSRSRIPPRVAARWSQNGSIASQEAKTVRTKAGTQERAKTALMIAPTWAEIDALNAHAREKLRAVGNSRATNIPLLRCARKTGRKRSRRTCAVRAGRCAGHAQATKFFAKGDELRVVRKEKRRLVVGRGAQEFSVSPRQSGMAWTVCEERPLAVATGERVRLRAVAACNPPVAARVGSRTVRRSACGPSTLAAGLRSPDGSILLKPPSRPRLRDDVARRAGPDGGQGFSWPGRFRAKGCNVSGHARP